MSSTIVGLIVVEAGFLAVCLISYGLRTPTIFSAPHKRQMTHATVRRTKKPNLAACGRDIADS